MKKTATLFFCTLATMSMIVSCNKKNNSLVHDKLVGSWRYHQLISDTNRNNTWDAMDELVTVDTDDVVIVYNSNGTGIQTIHGIYSGSFTWSINSNYIVITDSGSTASGLLIVSGPDSTLTVADTFVHPMQWDILNKL